MNFKISAEFSARKVNFSSFDLGVNLCSLTSKPDRYRHWSGAGNTAHRISRGAGLSYAAASFGSGSTSFSHDRFDRILDFDQATGEVEVETGIRLFSLHNFLEPRGYFLPVQPGHGQISVGGCIAADVHGKNQFKDGTFIEQVISLTLFHPDYGIIETSPTQNSELFHLTCGGYGLTGHILSVRLRTQERPPFDIITRLKAFSEINAGVELLFESADKIDFLHSWHDFSKKKTLGSGIIFMSSFSKSKENFKEPRKFHPIIPKQIGTKHRIPYARFLLNQYSLMGLNTLYKQTAYSYLDNKPTSLFNALFPIHSLQSYYSFLGNKGFHEYQVLLPRNLTAEFLSELGDIAKSLKIPITLASAKVFRGEGDLLRFTGNGVCFAVNFQRSIRAVELLKWLDEKVIAIKGKPNIIKDSRLPRHVVEACYPEVGKFRTQLKNFDPKRLFRSELSERLGL